MAEQSLNFLSNQSDLSFSSVAKTDKSKVQKGLQGETGGFVSNHTHEQKQNTGSKFSEKLSEVQLKEAIIIGKKGNPLPTIQPYFGDELPEALANEGSDGQIDLESAVQLNTQEQGQTNLESVISLELNSTDNVNNEELRLDLISSANENARVLGLSKANSLPESSLVNNNPTDVVKINPLETPIIKNTESALKIALEVNADPGKGDAKHIKGDVAIFEQLNLKQAKQTSFGLDDFVEENLQSKLAISENGVKGVKSSSILDGLLKHPDLNPKLNNPTTNFNANELESLSSTAKSIIPISSEIGRSSPSSQVLPNSNIQSGLALKNNFTPNLALRIKWVYQQALSSAEILMDPPELGPLSVKLTKINGETNILFQVNNPTTKDMIEDNLAKLKDLLAEQNINLGDTQVTQQQKDQNGQKAADENSTIASNSSDDDTLDSENAPDNDTQVGLLDTYI